MRRCTIRFRAAPGADACESLVTSLHALSPAPALHWGQNALEVEYAFPEVVFGDIRNVLRASVLHRHLGGIERARAALRALLEDNERNLGRPRGWRARVDRLYLACEAGTAARSRRGGALWRKHERHG